MYLVLLGIIAKALQSLSHLGYVLEAITALKELVILMLILPRLDTMLPKDLLLK